MNSIPNTSDAVANDVQYHLKCWVISQRNALKTASEKQEIKEIEDVNRVIADVEIIEIVRQNFTGDGILDMNNLNKTYNNLLGNDNEVNYKRYLKRLFNETIPGVVFSRPPARRLSEQLYSAGCQAKAIETYKNNSDDYTTIFEAAKIIRNELLKHRNWKFDGDFSGFDLPVSLSSLLRWIIVGPKNTVDTILKKNSIDNCVDNIAQIIVKASKSDRQVKHKSSPDANFREVVETPFSVGLGIHVHKETRSKKLVECLSDLGLSISYDKVMKIENDLGNAVSENISLNHGVFVPPNIQPGIPLHFAIDNIDFRNDTPDGKSEFHGTTHVVFQNNNKVNHELLKISRTKTFTFQHLPFQETNVTMKPNPPNEVFLDYEAPSSLVDLTLFRNADRIWGLCQVIDEIRLCQLPTWGAFNSLLADNPSVTVCQGLPLYPGSPTDWGNLYTALKIVQGINVSVTGKKRTIVTLDLQLYSKCMQMRERSDIKENYIFRLGELHIVFAFLKVIGKYILGSGLDQMLIEAGVYGPTTLGQILEGKHMKRGMEAHMIIYLSLYKVYVDNVLERYPGLRHEITTKANQLSADISSMDLDSMKNHHKEISAETKRILEIFSTYDESLNQQALFLRNYMAMYEVLLQFVRSSREEAWEMHLSSLDNMVRYFFVHDQLNYARLTPLYLATMTELKTEDVDSWNYLKDNFSINKSGIPFCSIGSDHALEQENKIMKLTGGVVGLTQNPAALHRFCLVAPFLSALSTEFCSKNLIALQGHAQHYQITGSTNQRISTNVKKMIQVFDTFDLDFKENGSVFNVLSKAVLPAETASDILCHEDIGKEMYRSFVDDRIKGEVSIWSPMKKRNLKTFRTQGKTIKTKIGEKVVQLKEERTLLSRFLITARKRPELDLEESIGNYEFAVVPKSIFTPDGQPLHSTDKAKVLHEIESMAEDRETNADETSSDESIRVIIIDGMALVNKVPKDDSMKTWKVIFNYYNLVVSISAY